MSRDGYRRGGFWRIDERSGERVRAYDTAKEWDGTIVDRRDFEARHPQDFVRGRRDDMRVPDARPEPEPILQLPPGGPFMLVIADGDNVPCIEIYNGNCRIFSGRTQLSPGDL